MSDQFTRFTCKKCGSAGHDSWNKSLHDGLDHGGKYPNPFIVGDECQCCGWPAVIAWYGPGERARAIYSPDEDSYAYEIKAMGRIERGEGDLLEFSDKRDADWSRGCVAARDQLQ